MNDVCTSSGGRDLTYAAELKGDAERLLARSRRAIQATQDSVERSRRRAREFHSQLGSQLGSTLVAEVPPRAVPQQPAWDDVA